MNTPAKAVFLSYASQDAEAARRLCEALRAADVEVWFDQYELRGGDAWDLRTRKQIRDCALFIPIISANTNSRTEGYFRLEWKLAVDRSHLMADDAAFLVPVVIDETLDATARVPDRFRAAQWTWVRDGLASAEFCQRVGELLKGAPGASNAQAPLSAPSRQHSFRLRYVIAGVAMVALAAAGAFTFLFARARPVTSPTEYQPLTDVVDSASAPALSADGKMLAYISGGEWFYSSGQIFLKVMPDGEPVQLTHEDSPIYGPAFSPDGARVAYTVYETKQGHAGWNSYSVPITGGEPSLMLGNAAGLNWIGPQQLLYSEISSGGGLHMGVVTSKDDRSGRREIYFPDHERAMAHLSYLSPDRHWLLVVQMEGSNEFGACRLVSFDGSAASHAVGPAGHCWGAAWSPDGKWMYFSAEVSGHSHLWRQRFPGGEAQQITFGPSEEIGVVMARDGQSLITAFGLNQRTIWLHDASGERRLTNENVAARPWLSADARRLYFLSARGSADNSNLWRLDIRSGQRDILLPETSITNYSVSRDERQLAYSTNQGNEKQIWVAPLDKREPPRLLVHNADTPWFDGSGHIYYRLLDEKKNYLYRMQADGTGKERVLSFPILEFFSMSPNGEWASVMKVNDGVMNTSIIGLRSGSIRWTREGYWPANWSADSTFLYLEVGNGDRRSIAMSRTLPIVLDHGAPPTLPTFPMTAANRTIPHDTAGFYPGPDPDTYVFTREEKRQNIFRIPLH